MKRGISTFPFLLIFVGIAGAIILMFFFGFGKDILFTSNKFNELSIAKSVDQQLAAFTLASNAYNEINLGKSSDISIICTDKNVNIKVDSQSVPTEKLILAPMIVSGNRLSAWTLSWDYPFKVENFYFLSNEDIQYAFEPQNTPEEIAFVNNMGNNLLKTDLNSLSTTSSSKKVVILFDEENPSSYINEPNVLKVVKLNLNPGSEQVAICDHSCPTCPLCESVDYLGNTLTYVAIFADSKATYQCIKNKAIERLNTITEIYIKKAETLQQQRPTSCFYDIVRLENLKDPETNALAVTDVATHNEDLILSSCPPIYAQ